MDLYERPAPRRNTKPAVVFLNERLKAHSFSSGYFTPPIAGGRIREDDLPNYHSTNQQQQSVGTTRVIKRPQSSDVRRPNTTFVANQETKERPRTARERLQKTISFTARTTCFTQDCDSPEMDGPVIEIDETSPSLDEQYLQQLKADIVHLHNLRLQLEKEADTHESESERRAAIPQAPNHVKHLLLHRDTKALSGWSSHRNLDLTADATSTNTIQTQLQRYNYSTDPAQLAAAKAGLEGILGGVLISLMEFCLGHDNSDHSGEEPTETNPFDMQDDSNAFKMELVRPSSGQLHGIMSSIPLANGCGTSPVSIYVGGIVSIIQQTEIFKRTMLACTGEKKILAKTIADKDAQLSHLAEQIGFFKDALASKRPRYEGWKRVPIGHNLNERDHGDPTDEHEQEADPSKSNHVNEEQLTRLDDLEKDRVELLSTIHALEAKNGELRHQLEKANFDLQDTLKRLDNAEQLHRESMDSVVSSLQHQVDSLEKRSTDLQSSLASTLERYRILELSSAQEKSQRRHDKQEFERLIRLRKEEAEQRQAQATAKADIRAQSAANQLKLVTKQLGQAQKMIEALRGEIEAAQADSKSAQHVCQGLRKELSSRNKDIEELTTKLAAANSATESKTALLEQTEEQILLSSQEIERQQTLLEQQSNQVQQLEAKLSRSIPVDDEELQSRQKREEGTWHQRVAALEHSLVAERQNTALFREQQRKALAMEKEKAAHAIEQAQAVAAELATANLCISERKHQRLQEQRAFEDKIQEFIDRTANLSSEKEALERELGILRRSNEHSADELKAQHLELTSLKEELRNLTEIRVNLDRALAHALSSPSSSKENQQVTAERRQIQIERAELDKMCASHHAATSKQEEDHELLQQIIILLSQRLQVLMTLFNMVPINEKLAAHSIPPEGISPEKWSELEQQWQTLRQEMEDADWKLAAMRDRLEVLHLEYVGYPWQSTPRQLLPRQHSSPLLRLPGFHGPNPFSDAVAAGRETVPVAEELKASRARRLSCPDESFESRARLVKAEDHETFALALAKEMTAMKDSYERQLEQLRAELRKTRQARAGSSKRHRAELTAQRSRSQRTIAELAERLSELDAVSTLKE